MIYLIDNTIDGQGAGPRELRSVLERIQPTEVFMETFRTVSLDNVSRLGPSHIILSGQSDPWDRYPLESLEGVFEVIKNASQPVLGVCGGHQQIALAYGAPVGLMERLQPGEGYEGARRERGYFPVETDENGIFKGLSHEITVWHSHCDEVRQLPDSFRRTAFNTTCAIQAMQHTERPLFGVQFHPEFFNEEHPEGRRLLENFLDI